MTDTPAFEEVPEPEPLPVPEVDPPAQLESTFAPEDFAPICELANMPPGLKSITFTSDGTVTGIAASYPEPPAPVEE